MEDSPVWTLGSLTLDPDGRDVRGVHWFLHEESGFFGSPKNTGTTTQRLNQHGGFRGTGWKTERSISLKGYAFASDYKALRQSVEQVTGMLSDPDDPTALTCHAETGPVTCDVFLDGEILTQPLDIQGAGIEWSLQVVAPDPRRYAVSSRTMRAGLPQGTVGDGLDFQAGGTTGLRLMAGTTVRGLDFTTDGGLVFGQSNATGFLQLVNAGTAPTSPIYTLYGPLVEPVLTATTGGITSLLQYNDTIHDGEFIIIDPSARAVLLGGTASRRHLLNPADFAGFYIPGAGTDNGVLPVGLTHSGEVTSGGYVTAIFRDAWF